MRKLTALALLLSLCLIHFEPLFAQSRPRRAEANTPATKPSPAPAPARTNRPPQSGTATPTPRAQEVGEEVGEDEVVRVNTALVTIPVTVLDRDGRFIPNLRKDDFRILEDGVEQQVAYFASVEQPFTVALVIDTSGSTRFKLEDIQDAAIAFLDQLRPEDRVIVVSFDDSVRLLSEATSDRQLLRAAIRRTRPGGGTRLYDAVDFVAKEQLSRVRGRKAIVLFTDGVDTTSRRASYQSTLGEAEELDALVYPIQYDTYQEMLTRGGGGGWPGPGRRRGGGIDDIISIIIGGGTISTGGGGGGRGTSREEYRRGGEYLRQMAAVTGGRHYSADDLGNLERAFTSIAEELRRQYSLGYYPARQSRESERRQIRVRVKRPNLVVRARDSYVYRPSGAPGPTARENTPQQSAPELRRRQFAR